MSTSEPRPVREHVIWTTAPPSGRQPYFPIVRVRVGDTQHAVILSHHMLGVYQHYDQVVTVPCIGRDNGCRPCLAGLSWRWYGYVFVLLPGSGKIGIMQITSGAVEKNPALADTSASLRGRYVKAYRRGRAVNGPLTVDLGKASGLENLPTTPDLKAALLRLWGIRPDDDIASSPLA